MANIKEGRDCNQGGMQCDAAFHEGSSPSIVNLPLTCYAFNTTLELATLSLIALERERKRESRFGRV